MRVEHLGLRVDSGGAGEFRGGLGYRKDIRVLEDASFMSVADRSILACWGVRGGLAGLPFRVTIDPGGPNERVLAGLCDDEPIAAGEVVRIETTGGGGWGDPLDRDPELVALDVLQGKVSERAARDAYGVVIGDAGRDRTGACGRARGPRRTGVLRPRAGLSAIGGDQAGLMFWLIRNRLPGSYVALISASRA